MQKKKSNSLLLNKHVMIFINNGDFMWVSLYTLLAVTLKLKNIFRSKIIELTL